MPRTIEFIAEAPKIVVMRRYDPPPEVCSCGAFKLHGKPCFTMGRVTHGELCCYRVVDSLGPDMSSSEE